jgi:hypothetical protein
MPALPPSRKRMGRQTDCPGRVANPDSRPVSSVPGEQCGGTDGAGANPGSFPLAAYSSLSISPSVTRGERLKRRDCDDTVTTISRSHIERNPLAAAEGDSEALNGLSARRRIPWALRRGAKPFSPRRRTGLSVFRIVSTM